MINKFFRWLFGGCEHKWEDEDKRYLVNSETEARVGIQYVQKCSKCHDMRRQTFYA